VKHEAIWEVTLWVASNPAYKRNESVLAQEIVLSG
jgi:hypothetical protein